MKNINQLEAFDQALLKLVALQARHEFQTLHNTIHALNMKGGDEGEAAIYFTLKLVNRSFAGWLSVNA